MQKNINTFIYHCSHLRKTSDKIDNDILILFIILIYRYQFSDTINIIYPDQ